VLQFILWLITIISLMFSGVHIFVKHCLKCKIYYRYQEWKEGLHNYNDFLILSMETCNFLRIALQVRLYLAVGMPLLGRGGGGADQKQWGGG
jgi:hypothetical protein